MVTGVKEISTELSIIIMCDLESTSQSTVQYVTSVWCTGVIIKQLASMHCYLKCLTLKVLLTSEVQCNGCVMYT